MALIVKNYRVEKGSKDSLFRETYTDFGIASVVPGNDGGAVLTYRKLCKNRPVVALYKEGEPTVTITGGNDLIPEVLSSLERDAGVTLVEIIKKK